MRFEVISYSNKAGMKVNCDKMVYVERADKVSAVLCSAVGDAEEERKKAEQCSLHMMEQLCLLEDIEKWEETEQRSEAQGVKGTASLVIRNGAAAWYCDGSARVYLFSDGECMEYREENARNKDKVKLKQGDALLICSRGFYRHVSPVEMEIDLCCSEDAGEWLENLLVRYLNSSELTGESISVFCCRVKEK